MPVKLFILGLPGSGKSAAAHYIETFARITGWTPEHFTDYPLLYEMYQKDKEGKYFRSTEPQGYDGFDVIDFRVNDDALRKLEGQVSEWSRQHSGEKQFLIIEFSRDEYNKSLDLFASHFSEQTYFLFIEADIDACKQRIHKRVEDPKSLDDHYVSESIFENYYARDIRNYADSVCVQLQEHYGISEQNMHVITNDQTVPEGDFVEQVKMFAAIILMPKP